MDCWAQDRHNLLQRQVEEVCREQQWEQEEEAVVCKELELDEVGVAVEVACKEQE